MLIVEDDPHYARILLDAAREHGFKGLSATTGAEALELAREIAAKDGELIIRHLNESFFKDQPMQTDADFRRLVEDNLDNAAMYDEGATTATRVGGK
jgi:CheY-like chemotaxis protein